MDVQKTPIHPSHKHSNSNSNSSLIQPSQNDEEFTTQNNENQVSCSMKLINNQTKKENEVVKKQYRNGAIGKMQDLAAKQIQFLKELKASNISCPVAMKDISQTIFKSPTTSEKNVQSIEQFQYSNYLIEQSPRILTLKQQQKLQSLNSQSSQSPKKALNISQDLTDSIKTSDFGIDESQKDQGYSFKLVTQSMDNEDQQGFSQTNPEKDIQFGSLTNSLDQTQYQAQNRLISSNLYESETMKELETCEEFEEQQQMILEKEIMLTDTKIQLQEEKMVEEEIVIAKVNGEVDERGEKQDQPKEITKELNLLSSTTTLLTDHQIVVQTEITMQNEVQKKDEDDEVQLQKSESKKSFIELVEIGQKIQYHEKDLNQNTQNQLQKHETHVQFNVGNDCEEQKFEKKELQEEPLDFTSDPQGFDLKSLNAVKKEDVKKTGKSLKSLKSTKSTYSVKSTREKVEVLALPILSSTIVGMGLLAGHKFLPGKLQMLGLVPGLFVGVAYYLNKKNIEQNEIEENEDEDEDIVDQINDQ